MLPDAFERELLAAGGQAVLLVAGREALCAERALAACAVDGVDESRVGPGPQQLREAVELCETPSFFGGARLVVAWGAVALAANARATQERDAELAALERLIGEPPTGSRLLVWAPDADKRLRAVRLLQGRGALLDASPPSAREYGAWVRHLAAKEGAQLTGEAARAYTESALDLLALEAALRVGAACAEGGPITGEVAAWAAPPGGELRVFALTDALLGRDARGLSAAVPRLLAQGESPIGLVALAARQLRLLARALGLRARGVAPAKWQAELGVHPFVAQKLQQALPNWSREDLGRALSELLACDLSLKSGAAQEAALLLSLLSAVRRSA